MLYRRTEASGEHCRETTWQDWLPLLMLVLLALGQLAIVDVRPAIERKFWFDEMITLALVTDPDPVHAWRALQGGVDYNPPTLYLLLRGVSACCGASEVSLRLFSLSCGLLATLGVFATLRRLVSPWAALAASLALWGHPEVIRQIFEARFYAPWLAALAWYCYFLLTARETGSSFHLAGLALTSAIVCTIHYFGCISLALLTIPLLIVYRAWFWPFNRQGLRLLLAVGAGPSLLLACVPLFLSQRATLSPNIRIDPPNVERVMGFCELFVPRPYLWIGAAVAVVGFITNLVRQTTRSAATPENAFSAVDCRADLWIVGSTALMPIVIIAFSYLVQPALVSRYALVGLVGCAALLGGLVNQAPRPAQWGAALAFFLLGIVSLHGFVKASQKHDRSIDTLIRALDRLPSDGIAVFENCQDLVPLVRYEKIHASQIFALDCRDDQISNPNLYRLFSRDVLRLLVQFYDGYQLLPLEELRQQDIVYLVPVEGTTRFGREYDGYTVKPVDGRLFRLTRKSP